VVPPESWRDWLDYRRPARDLLKALPGGTLSVCASAATA
jgi:hypothetical protein